MYPSELDRAWAAGLIDGEGCIMIARLQPKNRCARNVHHELQVTVGMTSQNTIERLYELWGGRTQLLKERPARRPAWRWTLTGRHVAPFLRRIRPFLVTKLQEVELALDAEASWGRLVGKKGQRHTISDETFALREGYCMALREAKKWPV